MADLGKEMDQFVESIFEFQSLRYLRSKCRIKKKEEVRTI